MLWFYIDTRLSLSRQDWNCHFRFHFRTDWAINPGRIIHSFARWFWRVSTGCSTWSSYHDSRTNCNNNNRYRDIIPRSRGYSDASKDDSQSSLHKGKKSIGCISQGVCCPAENLIQCGDKEEDRYNCTAQNRIRKTRRYEDPETQSAICQA